MLNLFPRQAMDSARLGEKADGDIVIRLLIAAKIDQESRRDPVNN